MRIWSKRGWGICFPFVYVVVDDLFSFTVFPHSTSSCWPSSSSQAFLHSILHCTRITQYLLCSIFMTVFVLFIAYHVVWRCSCQSHTDVGNGWQRVPPWSRQYICVARRHHVLAILYPEKINYFMFYSHVILIETSCDCQQQQINDQAKCKWSLHVRITNKIAFSVLFTAYGDG